MLVPTPRSVPRLIELKVADDALRRNQESLFATLASVGDGIISTDTQGRVVKMNTIAERLTGWAQADARGKCFSEVFRVRRDAPGEPSEGFDALLREATLGVVALHGHLIARDGVERPIADGISPLRDVDGRVSGVAVIFRDTTAERRAEQALLFAQRDFEEVIEKTLDGVAICLGQQIVYANPAFARSLGYGPDELCGKPILDLLQPEERDAVDAGLRYVSDSSDVGPFGETHFLRQDGEVATLELAPVQLIQFEGASATLLVARDVTENKKMQARLLLADRMVSVGTLAAGVAHEINNPLACVIANLDYVAEDLARITEECRALQAEVAVLRGTSQKRGVVDRLADLAEPLRDTRVAAERVRLVVRDLKTFSRSDEDWRGPVQVRQVMESSINMAWNEIRHRARLVKDYQTVPPVDGNEARLGQVFLNLLVNAAQAIPEGDAGRNEIRVSTRQDAEGRVVVEVSDTGAGILPHQRRRIFDPFFTTKPVGVGTGLGLPICHGIVTGLGGTIEVESEVGRGSIFRVTLPAAKLDQIPEREKTAPQRGPRGLLLFIDDEPSIGAIAQRVLGQDHDLVFQSSAREALRLLTGGARFDLIFCDLMMPEMTGMDLHAALHREAPELLDRLIFLTGGAFTPRAREFLESVPNPRLEKPFDIRELRALISERLRLARSAGA
ncbi:MAG: PAS domain S-box protein [Myxococcales bacterium]|nr:PAS domain S-box protein [Myxococcales bacterium]